MDDQSQLQNFGTDLLTSRMNKNYVGLTKQDAICFQVFVAADTFKLCNKNTSNNGLV